MPAPLAVSFWTASYKMYYEAYFQELTSEVLLSRWQFIDNIVSFLGAATATGSAIAGWTLWSTQAGKVVWAGFSGSAMVASLMRTHFGVQGSIKEQEELRRLFQQLRLGLQNFRTNLETGIITDEKQAQAEFQKLQAEHKDVMGKKKPVPFFMTPKDASTDKRLHDILEERGDIDESPTPGTNTPHAEPQAATVIAPGNGAPAAGAGQAAPVSVNAPADTKEPAPPPPEP